MHTQKNIENEYSRLGGNWCHIFRALMCREYASNAKYLGYIQVLFATR